MQGCMLPDPGALPRLGFERIAKEARCAFLGYIWCFHFQWL